ncbi:protein kinase [bacterium]|nr:protein kinase [bacterium]
MIGKRLGHYEVLSRLGRGGMGEVFLARDERLGREVALKLLPPDVAGHPARRARLAREAQAVAALQHPGIVTIHAIEEMDGHCFLAMERIDGAPLSESIPAGGLPTGRLLDLAAQLADAVGAAHARGITHRDLKPANVMVDGSGRVKVLDFGLAKTPPAIGADAPSHAGGDATVAATAFADSLTTDGSVVGTVHYMAPEQAEGRAVTPASDVFALGILLYEMATGERPFRGDTPLSILSSILRDDPPPVTKRNAALPAALDAVVARCLEKDPRRRYADANELRDALATLREGGSAAGALPPAGRKRAGSIVLVVAATLIAALLAWVVMPTGKGPAARSAVGASGRPSVAVFQFRDHSGDEEIRWLATGAPSMLLTGLAQTPGLDVVSSARVDEILRKIGRENAEQIDQSILAEVARRSGAGAVVLGSIFKSGETIRIDVQIEDVETGKLLFAREASGSDPFPIVDQLTVAIRDGLELSDRANRGRPIADVSSGSLDAYRAYDEGARSLDVFRLSDARRALVRAIDLDPGFAMAHYLLARIETMQGQPSSSDEHIVTAWENRDRLPERQHALVEAAYQSQIRDDPQAAAAVLEELIRRFPDEVAAYLLLSSVVLTPDPEEGLDVLRRGVDAVPTAGTLRNQYAMQLIRTDGSFDEARRQREIYEKLEPEEVNPRDSLAEVFLGAGRPANALEKYAEVLRIEPGFASAHAGRALAFGMLGQLEEALDEFDRAIALLEEQGMSANGLSGPRALLMLRAGKYDASAAVAARDVEPGIPPGETLSSRIVGMVRAMREADYAACAAAARGMESGVPASFPEFYRRVARITALNFEGTAEARAGNPSRAREIRDRIEGLGRNPVNPWAADWLAGEIALAEGDLEEAERVFRAGIPTRRVVPSNIQQGLVGSLVTIDPPSRDWEARLLEARGDLDGAIAVYDALNEPGEARTFGAMYEPLYLLEVARLLDRQGKREEAAAEARRFLEFWKHADDDRPELAEARAYLAAAGG